VLLVLVPAAAAINEWLGLPEGKFHQLGHLLDGMYRILCIVMVLFLLCSLNLFVNDVSRLHQSTSIFNSRSVAEC